MSDVTPPAGYTLDAPTTPALPAGYSLDAGNTPPAVPVAATTTPDESLFQKVNDFGNNMGDAFVQNISRPAVGITQLASRGITGIANAIAPNSDVARSLTDQNNERDQSIHDEEAQYQKDVPTNAASLAGATIGQALPFAVDAVPNALQAIGTKAASFLPDSLPLLQKIVSGGTQGATVAAAQPVTSQGNFAANKAEQVGIGSATGGAIPVLAASGRGINALAQNFYDPAAVAANNLGRTLQATPDTINTLSTYKAPINGETPTTAQVIGGPRAAMVEKAAANSPDFKIALTENQNNNNAARIATLQSIAGDPQQLQNAITARQQSIQPFVDANLTPATPAIRYTKAQQPIADALSKPMVRDVNFQALNDANKVLQNVKNGSMQEDDALEELGHIAATTKQGGNAQQAIQESVNAINHNMIDPSAVLQQIAKARNSTTLGVNPTVRSAMDTITGNIKDAQNINGLVPANLLEGIRQNAGDILNASTTGNSVVGTKESAGIAPVKQAVQQLLSKNVPGFDDYLANYAEKSAPINDMQLAQGALDSAATRRNNTADVSQLNLSDINKVLRGSNTAQYGLSDDAQQKIEALQNSLKSTDVANAIRSPGSDTNFNAQAHGWLGQQMLGNNLQGTTGPARVAAGAVGALLGDHLGGPGGAAAGLAAGAYINKAANFVNNRIMSRYNAGLLDPATAKTMLQQYLTNNAKQAPTLVRQNPAWQALLAAPVSNAVSKP